MTELALKRKHYELGTMLPFLFIDLAFFGANLLKIFTGGYVPVILAAALMTLMWTWVKGTTILFEKTRKTDVPLLELVGMLEKSPPHRVKGTAVFLTSDPDTAPAALLHTLDAGPAVEAHRDRVELALELDAAIDQLRALGCEVAGCRRQAVPDLLPLTGDPGAVGDPHRTASADSRSHVMFLAAIQPADAPKAAQPQRRADRYIHCARHERRGHGVADELGCEIEWSVSRSHIDARPVCGAGDPAYSSREFRVYHFVRAIRA